MAEQQRQGASRVRHFPPGELPIWQPGEEQERLHYEIVRDNWIIIRLFATAHNVRSITVLSREVAEALGEWPPTSLLINGSTELGIFLAEAKPSPETEVDFDSLLVNVCLSGAVAASCSFDLKDGPPGAAISSPPPTSWGQILAKLGDHRANMIRSAIPHLAVVYQQSLAQGVSLPALLCLDLDCDAALAILRNVNPSCCPTKQELDYARRRGLASVQSLSGSPEEVSHHLADCSVVSAERVLCTPPNGFVWLTIVAEERCLTMTFPISILLDAGQIG